MSQSSAPYSPRLSLGQRFSLAAALVFGAALPHRSVKAGLRLWGDWYHQQPLWLLGNEDAYISEGYERNTLIYRAVLYKANAVAAAPLRAYLGDRDNPEPAPPDHPLSQLLERPAPQMLRWNFQALAVCFLGITGNAFIWLQRTRSDVLPSAMYVLRPDRIKVVPGSDNTVKGYYYTPPGKNNRDGWPIVPDDMIHVKLPNLSDPLAGLGKGMSPLLPAGRAGDIDNEVTDTLKRFFQHGMMLAGLLKYKVALDDDQKDAARARWRELYGGAENWFDSIGVLDEDADYQRISPTFNEMGFEGIDARNEARILMALGVPPILVGALIGLKHSTYSNYETARRAFWEDSLIPELGLFDSAFLRYLTTADGAFAMHDLSDVPALRKSVVEQTTAARNLWTMGTPPYLAYQVVGLRVPRYPGDDQSRLVLPSPNKPQPAEDGSKPTDAEPPNNGSEPPKILHPPMWVKMTGIADRWQTDFENAAREAFEADRRELLALLPAARQKALQRKATLNWNEVEIDALTYLKQQAGDQWRETFIPLLEGIALEGGQEWAAKLGLAFNLRSLDGEAWFADYTLTFAQPITQTTSDDIQAMLLLARKEGWSIDQMTDRLDLLFKQYMDGGLTAEDFRWFEDRLPAYRRELIARVESMRMLNVGTFNLGKQWGANRKEWLATFDDRVRDTHEDAGRRYVAGGSPGPIPLDEPFIVGGYTMMYPLDLSQGAPLSEVMDCRCAVGLVMD